MQKVSWGASFIIMAFILALTLAFAECAAGKEPLMNLLQKNESQEAIETKRNIEIEIRSFRRAS
jgi:predicted membrane protein